jgi:hypothetical protein
LGALSAQEFFKAHPELVGRRFFIAGPDYAGKYIPVIATRILQGNKESPEVLINLQVRRTFPHFLPLVCSSALRSLVRFPSAVRCTCLILILIG